MRKEYWSPDCDDLLLVTDEEPVCGEDFCDACGDCLSCYGGDDCTESRDGSGSHRWIEYVEQ